MDARRHATPAKNMVRPPPPLRDRSRSRSRSRNRPTEKKKEAKKLETSAKKASIHAKDPLIFESTSSDTETETQVKRKEKSIYALPAGNNDTIPHPSDKEAIAYIVHTDSSNNMSSSNSLKTGYNTAQSSQSLPSTPSSEQNRSQDNQNQNMDTSEPNNNNEKTNLLLPTDSTDESSNNNTAKRNPINELILNRYSHCWKSFNIPKMSEKSFLNDEFIHQRERANYDR